MGDNAFVPPYERVGLLLREQKREAGYAQHKRGVHVEDQDVLDWIRKLEDEEHELLKMEEQGGTSVAKRARRREIEGYLDQCWDLLRQRRAKRRAGLNPESTNVREKEMIEHYEQ
jgi:hypothetical protein